MIDKEKVNRVIYMDNAASTKPFEAVLDTMREDLEYVYANPSSGHSDGRFAAGLLQDARRLVAACIGADRPEQIIFTSGGTEGNNMVLRNFCTRKNYVSAIEHHSVLNTASRIAGHQIIPVDIEGVVDPMDVYGMLLGDTNAGVVSVMLANNEIGTIEPIADIARVCHELGVQVHTDAVQAAGHIPIDVNQLGVDYLTMSAHKFHGPRGIGAVYVRNPERFSPIITGGGQEFGLRAGTENVAGAVSMAIALHLCCASMKETTRRLDEMTAVLREMLGKIPGCVFTGSRNRIPGHESVCFEGVDSEALLLALDLRGICASAGSACTTGLLEPSHVLTSIGVPRELANGSLRLSLSEFNTLDEVRTVGLALQDIVPQLRKVAMLNEENA